MKNKTEIPEENKEEIEKTEWNLNNIKIQLIGKKMFESDIQYSKQNLPACFICWKYIRLIISNRFSPEELKKCKSKEKTFFADSEFRRIEGDMFRKTTYNFGKMLFLLENYMEYVNKLLKKYGLDMASKESNEHLY